MVPSYGPGDSLQTESPFRIALPIVILLTTSIAIYFRRKASSSGDKITYEREGLIYASFLRLAAVLLLLSTTAYLLEPSIVSFANLPFWLTLRWIGVAVAFLGVFFMTWTLAALGKNLTDTVITRADSVLITHGPYRFVRHPYYTSTAMLIVSVFAMTANGLIGASGLIVWLLLAFRTPKEEQVLIERFGERYLSYRRRTGMFVPSLRRTNRA